MCSLDRPRDVKSTITLKGGGVVGKIRAFTVLKRTIK